MDFLSFTGREVSTAAAKGGDTREEQLRKPSVPQIPDKVSAKEYTRRLVYMSSMLHDKLGQPFYGSMPFQPTIGEGRCLSFSNNEIFFLFHCGGVGDFSLMARNFNEQQDAWVYIVAYAKRYAHKILYASVANNGVVSLVAETGSRAYRIDLLNKMGEVFFHKKITVGMPYTFGISGNKGCTRLVVDQHKKEEGYCISHTFYSVSVKEAPHLRTVEIGGVAYHKVEVGEDDFSLVYENKEQERGVKKPDFVHRLDERGNHWSKLAYRRYIVTHVPASKRLALYRHTYLTKEERLSQPSYLSFLLDLEKKVQQHGVYEAIGECYLHRQDVEKALIYWERALEMKDDVALRRKCEALRGKHGVERANIA